MKEITTEEFNKAVQEWMVGSQKIIDDHWKASQFTYAMSPLLVAKLGERYVIVQRIDRDKEGALLSDRGSAHAFIDMIGGNVEGAPTLKGDVFKPASWKKPAKHARGNIFDAKNGLGSVGPYGPAYLK